MVIGHCHLAHVQTQAKPLPMIESKTMMDYDYNNQKKPSAKAIVMAGIVHVPAVMLILATTVARIE